MASIFKYKKQISFKKEFDDIFEQLMNDNTFYDKASEICQNYVKLSVGATDKIVKHLKSKL